METDKGLKGKYSDDGKYSNGTAVEGEHFNIETDGNGGKHRVINFNNEDICPRKGIVELRAIYGTHQHENRHLPWNQVSRVYDKRLNVIFGIPTRINNKTKDLEFQRITLRDREVFDLSNFQDAMKWCVIKNSHFVEGSPNLRGNKPKYRVYDKERAAELFLNKRNVKRKAEGIAEGLMGEQLVEMARNCGMDITLMSPTVMSMEVIKYAEQRSTEFMEIWDSPNRFELTILKRAIANGVVVLDPRLGYTFGSLPLGVNEPQALQYLKDNIQTRQVIDMQSKKNEVDSIKAMSVETQEPIKDERDAEIALLKQRLAESEKNIQQISNAKIEEVAKNILETTNPEDQEFLELKAEAERLKIQGWAVIKDKEKLRQKIKDRVAQIKN